MQSDWSIQKSMVECIVININWMVGVSFELVGSFVEVVVPTTI